MPDTPSDTADTGDPVPELGVHVLTEFVYCPRAGIIAYESEAEDRGLEPSVSHLDFLPFYELADINDQLKWLETRLMVWLGVSGLIAMAVGWQFVLAAVPPLVILGVVLVRDVRRMLELLQRRSEYESAEAWLPDADNPEPEEVNTTALR